MSIEAARTEGEAAAEALLQAVAEFNTRLSTRITAIASGIETDANGRIVSSSSNIARVGELIAAMKAEFLDQEFIDAVTLYVESLDSVTANVVSGFDGFEGLDEEVLNAISRRYKQEAANTLTNPDTYDASIWQTAASGLIYGAATGALLDATLGSLGEAVAGSNMVSDVEAVTVSAPLMLQRTGTAAAAEQTGAKFFLFQGRPIKTTRPWCREREGKYWHIEEIKEWGRKAAKGDGWDGMVEGTNEQTIFVHLGGWFGERNSCRHILVPQLQFAVPEEDLTRMREKGLL